MSKKEYLSREFHGRLTKTQLSQQTLFTRSEGVEMDMKNRKPFRSKSQKLRARDKAYRDERGIWHSNVEVTYP